MSQSPFVVKPLKNHVGTFIFIHGLGDSGYGWADGMEMIQPKSPHIKFILPHAPQRRITINGGEKMPGWYDISSLNFSNRADDLEGLNESKATINSIIEAEIKAGIPPKNIIVGGFSQGAVMALYTLFQFPQTLGGCVVLSGYVPVSTTFSTLINESNKQTPVLMYHGEADAVVAFEYGKKSYELLKQSGLNVSFVNVPGMPHTATEPELLHVGRFINQLIPLS